MKPHTIVLATTLTFLFGLLKGGAQTSVAVTALSCMQTQIVTLTCSNGLSSSYNCNTNQIITVNSFIDSSGTTTYAASASMSFCSGVALTMKSISYSLTSLSGGVSFTGNQSPAFTGVTNINMKANNGYSAALTLTILTPSTNGATYTPANSVVIPSDATGNVQIILQSSSDLVNWVPSLPGTYGSTYSNRFFRVIAVAQ